jgi:hypothetical protein
MRAFVVKFLCQPVTGQIPALECLLPGTHGRLWLHLILYVIKWNLFLRILTLELATQYWQPPRVATKGSSVC